MQALIRYYNIASLGEIFRLEQGRSTSIFIREPTIPDLAYSIQTQDVTLCEAAQMIRALLGSQWTPSAIYLIHEPKNTRIYQSVFGCPVYFNQEMQALAFPTADLDLPLKKANSVTRKNLEEQMATLAREQKKSFLLQAQQAIKLGLVVGDCSVNFTADKLSMHTRTLHRKLRQEDTTFTELLDNTRRQLADHLVSHTPMSIFNIGQTLGYSDDTAFSRSFRRWFGAPPSRWRQRKVR
jgi:AraC-like DNA-binding protein